MTLSHSALITTIAQEVASVAPYDSLEESHIASTLQWVKSTNAIFRVKKPDIPPKHLVSYFVLIDEQHKSILLCDHIKAQLWLPPGGRVEVVPHRWTGSTRGSVAYNPAAAEREALAYAERLRNELLAYTAR